MIVIDSRLAMVEIWRRITVAKPRANDGGALTGSGIACVVASTGKFCLLFFTLVPLLSEFLAESPTLIEGLAPEFYDAWDILSVDALEKKGK
jgi:hypothetical protein